MNTAMLTVIAMIAFAGNSLLCRLALGDLDAASFTSVRIIAGAVTLALIMLPRQELPPFYWRSVSTLFVYMVFFSFAYLSLSAGTGALILFGAVQLTMFIVAMRRGERFTPVAWTGLAVAGGGLIYLLIPGITAPDPFGAALMAIAGVAWGGYSLLGRGASPLAATASNFVYCAPLAIGLGFLGDFDHPFGLLLAAASGAITSGIGYAIWYAALRDLAASRAATVQLSVPIIAAVGGVVLLAEPLSLRLVVASVLTLGGIAMVLSQRVAR